LLNLSLKGNAPPSSPPLDDITYHKYADETIDLLMDFLDALGDGHDIPGYDAVYAVRFLQYGLTKIRATQNGVVTLKLGSVGTYVVNKQPPNKQLWLSSPSSGPKRYDYDSARHKWVYAHDNLAIEDLLKQELERALKIKVDLDLSVPRAH